MNLQQYKDMEMSSFLHLKTASLLRCCFSLDYSVGVSGVSSSGVSGVSSSGGDS